MLLKCLTMLEACNSLGHGSNQVHQSLTHMWHLWAFPTSMHRLSEPSSFSFGVLIRFLETSLTTHSLILTQISWRNSYLDIYKQTAYLCACAGYGEHIYTSWNHGTGLITHGMPAFDPLGSAWILTTASPVQALVPMLSGAGAHATIPSSYAA